MVWVSAVFLAVTAVLTIAAWWLRKKSRWPSAEPRDDRVDQWLIEHYRLTSLDDCHQVRNAVHKGCAVGDLALREAARGLAVELLSGRLRDRNPAALPVAGLYVLVGALYLGTGLIGGGRKAALNVLLGISWLLCACVGVWGWWRLSRRKVERALQLNESDQSLSGDSTGQTS